MSSASRQKPKPPARPPLPRGSLPLGGMSFKKLENKDEEEEEDLTITDKYSSLLHHSVVSPSISDGLNPGDTDTVTGAPPDREGVASFIQKKGNKSVLEYKELLSGLKGKIQEKISKTIEDFSSDSSLPGSELLSKKLGMTAAPVENEKEQSSKTSSTKLQKSSTDPLIRPPLPAISRARSEEKQDSTENTPPQSVELSLITDKISDEENIVVMDKHFMQQTSETLDTETTIRCRSALMKETESPKSCFSNSMSGVARSTALEDSQQQVGEENGVSKHEQNENFASVHGGESVVPLRSRPVGYLNCLTSRLSHRQQLLLVLFCVCACPFLPIPSFMAGMLIGCMLTSLCLTLYDYVVQPGHVKEAPALVPLEDLPPMEIPEMKEATLLDGIYKGWMNETGSYNAEEYHIKQTTSVLVSLEGTKLQLQRPKNCIPKRAMHDEDISSPQFVEERFFELKGGRVSLLPPGLIRKRVWSKKYPICIALAEPGTKRKTATSRPVDLAYRDGSELFPKEKCDTSVLFLFARTGREKEEWFHRFYAATQDKPLANAVLEMRRAIERYRQFHQRKASSEGLPPQQHNSTGSQSPTASDLAENTATEVETVDPVLEFTRYMGHLMPSAIFSRLLASPKSSKESGAASRSPFTGSIICDSQLYWLNALIGRCSFDFLRDTWWADKVRDKLQRKLSKIHIPYFIEELQVTAIDLGKEMPVIRRAANPYLDEQGFWVELDVSYSGGFTMTIETKVNLMKLKRNNPLPSESAEGSRSDRSPVTDPDEEDSAESSTDDEEEACSEEKESGGGSKRLLKYLDKLTSSKYFQQATEYKYIKRAMENVSNTPLQLQVSVKNLVGKLAINIPPPPSDRLWYGFRGPPRLWLVAKPQVGERVVTLTHITEWIQRKLEQEFQRVFVMPNMDDLVIPILRTSDDEELTLNLAASASPSEGFSLALD